MDTQTKDRNTEATDVDAAAAVDVFGIALQARVDYAMAICTTDPGSTAWHDGLEAAKYGAYTLGRELAGADEKPACSPMLADVRMLREAFEEGVSDARREAMEWEVERLEDEARRARQATVERAIEAGDWAALDLPTPERFVAALEAGKSIEADGHTFLFVEGEALWCTNPYGDDTALGFALPSVGTAHAVLSALARGAVYGAVPPGSD